MSSLMLRWLFVAATVLMCVRPASATIVFSQDTSNVSNIGNELSLDVDQIDVTASQVRFKVTHAGATSLHISEVYWHDSGGLLSNLMLISATTSTSPGVDYGFTSVAPPNPPGVSGTFVTAFSGDEMDGTADGVRLNEMAGFKFDLSGGTTLQNVLAAIDNADIRMALHIRSIGGGSSDTYSTKAIPEPSAFLLVALVGLVVVVSSTQKRHSKLPACKRLGKVQNVPSIDLI